MSKQPPPTPPASAVGPCPTVIQIVGRPALEVYPAPSHPPTTPTRNGLMELIRMDKFTSRYGVKLKAIKFGHA